MKKDRSPFNIRTRREMRLEFGKIGRHVESWVMRVGEVEVVERRKSNRCDVDDVW